MHACALQPCAPPAAAPHACTVQPAAPLPTLPACLLAPAGSAAAANVKYLGRSGVTQLGGLAVAFLDGRYNAAAFREGGGRGPGCRYYGDNGARRRCVLLLLLCVAGWVLAAEEGVLRLCRAGAGPAGLCCSPPLQTANLCLPAPLLPCHPPADVDRLKLALAQAEGDIDVLLTCEWPQGVADGLAEAARPQGIRLDGAWVLWGGMGR